MREALDAVHNGMSVSKASVLYGIPRTTLNDHKLGKAKPGVKPGAPSLLSMSEEEDSAHLRRYWLWTYKDGSIEHSVEIVST